MLLQSAFLAFALLGSAFAQDTSLAVVKRTFDEALVPGNLSLPFDPTVLLEVTFPQTTGRPITLHAGIQLPRNATAGPPVFRVVGPAGRGPFVVATVDLDAPTPQTRTSAQIRHFLGGNFVFETPRDHFLLTNTTAALSEFRQPTPPAGSDPHRYVFLLFKQSKAFNTQTLVTPATSIANFNISTFAAAVGLGQPLGGTFMLVGPDPTTA
ncbi:26 kDa secreted antigen [Psilocybe cubensis]|uniref:PEBP-like protein n=2 Tax=Psilocybe cubensis TaxID=181762 RepID=A0A8H7XW01_PSICU|nr:26 kDa secreted antigen [Psilocybe cubensis]KAH9479677.1 26 kDa secreted antigen [Psilocybe cubensis]